MRRHMVVNRGFFLKRLLMETVFSFYCACAGKQLNWIDPSDLQIPGYLRSTLECSKSDYFQKWQNYPCSKMAVCVAWYRSEVERVPRLLSALQGKELGFQVYTRVGLCITQNQMGVPSTKLSPLLVYLRVTWVFSLKHQVQRQSLPSI